MPTPETPSSPLITRRDAALFIGGAAFTLTTAGIAQLFRNICSPNERDRRLRTLEREFENRRSAYAKRYMKEGRIPKPDQELVELLSLKAAIEAIKGRPEDLGAYVEHTDVAQRIVLPALADIGRRFDMSTSNEERRRKNLGGNIPVESLWEKLSRLKDACFSHLGPGATYNKAASSVLDPLHPDAKGVRRMQCESATVLFLLAAHHSNLGSTGERVVQIFVRGHTMPGMVDAQGNLYGIEMTGKDTNIVAFGPLRELGAATPMVVVEAPHALASQLLTSAELSRIHPAARGLLADTRPKTTGNGNGSSHYAFGEVQVRDGDQSMEGRTQVNASDYWRGLNPHTNAGDLQITRERSSRVWLTDTLTGDPTKDLSGTADVRPGVNVNFDKSEGGYTDASTDRRLTPEQVKERIRRWEERQKK